MQRDAGIPLRFAARLLLAGMLAACIVALLDHANDADSSAGALAAIKATNPQVKRFARMMMADHHRLRNQGADLARKLGVTPQPPVDDPITPLALQGMDDLEAAAKGLDFGRTYIRHEIAAHRTVLDLADQAHEAAGNAELKAQIEQARPLLENHLKQAQALEKGARHLRMTPHVILSPSAALRAGSAKEPKRRR